MSVKRSTMCFSSVSLLDGLCPVSDNIFVHLHLWSLIQYVLLHWDQANNQARYHCLKTRCCYLELDVESSLLAYIWCLIVNKYHIIQTNYVFFVGEERKYVLHWSNATKIFTGPRFTFIFNHLMHFFRDENDRNAETRLVLTISWYLSASSISSTLFA